MLTVAILVNGQPIFARTAVNRGPMVPGRTACRYEVDDGNDVIHEPKAGAVALAHALLNLLNEQMEPAPVPEETKP